MSPNHLLALATLGLAFAEQSLAQVSHVPAYFLYGVGTSNQYGASVSGAGDVDGDGVGDLLIGEPYGDVNVIDAGTVHVISGRTGLAIYSIGGSVLSSRFGEAVGAAGDVNADGFADFIVGNRLDGTAAPTAGAARIYSGATGLPLYTFLGDGASDNLGRSVAGVGDVNLDGFDDVIVGIDRDDYNGVDSGSIRVYSGATGLVLFQFDGDSANDRLGVSVSGAGDVNNDGYPDFIAGANLDDNNGADSGSARVYSGFNGAILYTVNGDSAGDSFGASVSGAGDLNHDGFADFVVGANADDDNGANCGSVRVFSGATGAVLYTWYGDTTLDQLGFSVSGGGDLDADGFDDILAGAPFDDNGPGGMSGAVRAFSGSNGAILYTFYGDSTSDRFGFDARLAGDINGDGAADIIIGASGNHYCNISNTSDGSAHVFLSMKAPTPPPAPCPGNANADSVVNFDDINAVIANWLNTCP